MTLLTICKQLALNVGMEQPLQVIGGSREWQEAASFSNQVGDDLARRVDWGQLTATATITGDGSATAKDMPDYFSRLVEGVCVKHGASVVRPLSRAEWGSLTDVEGNPRYFLLQDDEISFWPYLAAADTATVIYQSSAWCSNGTAEWSADDNTSLIDEDIMALGLIVSWRRQKGMPYQDEEAEYEAAIEQVAKFNDRSRL